MCNVHITLIRRHNIELLFLYFYHYREKARQGGLAHFGRYTL